jgi:hypothetical protein
MQPAAPVSPIAGAVESFIGIRVALPNGKMFVARKPLYFEDALLWMERLEQNANGAPYSETLKLIVDDLKTKLDVEDLTVLQDLTFGEVHDYVFSSFFSHRRSLPGWMEALLAQQASQRRSATPPSASSSPT